MHPNAPASTLKAILAQRDVLSDLDLGLALTLWSAKPATHDAFPMAYNGLAIPATREDGALADRKTLAAADARLVKAGIITRWRDGIGPRTPYWRRFVAPPAASPAISALGVELLRELCRPASALSLAARARAARLVLACGDAHRVELTVPAACALLEVPRRRLDEALRVIVRASEGRRQRGPAGPLVELDTVSRKLAGPGRPATVYQVRLYAPRPQDGWVSDLRKTKDIRLVAGGLEAQLQDRAAALAAIRAVERRTPAPVAGKRDAAWQRFLAQRRERMLRAVLVVQESHAPQVVSAALAEITGRWQQGSDEGWGQELAFCAERAAERAGITVQA